MRSQHDDDAESTDSRRHAVTACLHSCAAWIMGNCLPLWTNGVNRRDQDDNEPLATNAQQMATHDNNHQSHSAADHGHVRQRRPTTTTTTDDAMRHEHVVGR